MVDVAYNLREMCLKNEKRFSVASNIQKKIGNNTTNVIQKSQEPEYLEPEYLDDCIEDVNRHLTDLDNDIIVICDETPQNTVEAKRSGDIKKVHNSYLENSNTIHDQESLFCRMCNKFFRRKITLISHITSFHRLKYFEPQYETESTEVEFGQRKRCKINPKIDETAEIKFTGNVKPKIRGTRKKVIYKCQNCTETFEGEKIFDKHSQSCKSNEIQKLNAECQNVKPKIRGTRKKAIYKCQNCTETFEGEKIFDKHSQSCKSNEIQKPNADSQNDKIIAAESLVISAENQCASDTLIDFMSSSKTFVIKNELSSNPEPCSATCCGIEFQMGSLLQLHTYKTHGKSCGICNENFSSFNALFYHLLTHSAETPALQCTDCEVMFETKEQLRGHRCLRYKCDMCGVTCRSKLRFDSHMKTHQKLATYQCDKCEMGFTTKFSFTRHYQSIHKQVPSNVSAQKTTASVKSVKCEDCHRSFQSNEYIRNHKCISYTCKDCGMTLMSKYRFERHIIKHNTTKTEVCHICNKLFTARSTLVRHMRIHQDNQCQLCNELCVSSQVLTNHYLKQHCNNMSVCLIDYKKHGVYDLKIKGQNVQLNNYNNSINKIRTNTVRSFCYFCNKDFLTAKLFFKHVRSIHSYCKVCQTELNSGKTMVRHIYRHYQQFYNSMNELTVDPEVLTKCTNSKPNKRSKKPKQAKELKECVTYSCDFCTFKGTDKTTFDYHVLNHDQSATDVLKVDPKVLTNYANSKPNKLSKKPKQAKELKESVTYSCDVCTFKAADKTTFDDHVLNHDQSATDVLKVDQEVLTNANSKSNKRLKKPKQAKKLKECVTYSCGVCTFKDTDKTAFDDHVLNHDQNATDIIYCRFGEFEFSDDAYIDHLTIMHRRCFICKQGFQSNPELKKHKQTHVLTGSFIIECPTNKKCEYSEEPNCDNLSLPTCSDQSSNVESLKANIEQCSMTCKFCNKMFESEVECKEHVEAIHCTSSDCDVNQENNHAQIQEEKEV